MIGGTVIENTITRTASGTHMRQLWCVDVYDECAVFASLEEAAEVRPGDKIWWQGGIIYWTRQGEFTDREIKKIGFSFDPRKVARK